MADKVTDKMTSASLAAEVEKLPDVEIDTAWESDPIKFKSEIENVLKQKSLPVDRPFKSTIWFNQPSKVTGKAKHTTLVMSLSLRKSVRLQGDDVYLALQGKKELSKYEIEFLKEVFLRNR